MTRPEPRPPTPEVEAPPPPAMAPAPVPTSGPDPRDVKDRRETGWIGVASAGMVAVAAFGLLLEGGTGGGLLLTLLGLGVLIVAVALAVVSWRFGRSR